MPNKYVKKKIPKYTQEDLTNAVREVKHDSLTMYAAAQKYGIPSTTLYDKIKETYRTNVVGRRLAIPWEEENRLAEAIKVMEKWGFGLSREEVLNLIAEFVKKNNLKTPFTNNKPGKDWFINFRKRHRLSIKKPQPVEYVRKKMTDPFVISEYFKLLGDKLTDLNLFQRPHLIWNMDETSLSLDPTRTKVVGAINKPCSRTTCGTGKENITVLTTVSAAGKKLSPLIVFKGKNVWDQWMATTENYDFELSYASSSKGWMETEIFYNYMEKILIPALGEERPVLIIYDGHSTHVDTKVIELAIKNDLTILKLPPHTSHLLQPLDVAVFKSFKTKWDAKLVEWQRHNVGTKMSKKVFAQTFAETWQETNPDLIKSGFKKAGIHPFDAQVITEDKYDPAAYRRFKDEKSYENSRRQAPLSHKTPKSLKELCVKFFNKEFQSTKELGIPGQDSTSKNVIFLSALSKMDKQNQPFVAKSTSSLPECLQNNLCQPTEKEQPKIQIISNIKINFEELLLEKIRQDKNDITSLKRKRVAKGAEVITASINIKKTEEKKKQESTDWADCTKKRDSKRKKKLKTQTAKPGPSGMKVAKNEKQSKNKSKHDSTSSTSISDIMSIYSEIEDDYERWDELWDEEYFDKRIDEEELASESKKSEQKIVCSISNDRKIFIEEDLNIKKSKGKGKGKKTNTGKENQFSKECEIQENIMTDIVLRNNEQTNNINKAENSDKTKESNTENSDKTDEKMTKGNKLTQNWDNVEKKRDSDEEKEEYKRNDAVLVRYFIRKKWTYYIGFIENTFQKNNETYYTVDFLRTIKRPHLAFVQPKKKDRDDLTKLLIVKKVGLKRSNENYKEFYLTDENDNIYF